MPLKTHHDEIPAINLTPMIDIVFNLIIFFMVSTRFTEIEKQVELSVPQVGDVSKLNDAPKSRVISVLRDGQLMLDAEPVTLPSLTSRLSEARRQNELLGVVVRGDADSSFQSVAGVLTACRQAGISELSVSVRLGDAGPGAKRR